MQACDCIVIIRVSLQIDYSSLVDVRIVKPGNLNTTKAVTNGVNEVSAGDQSSGWGSWPDKNKETQGPTQGIDVVYIKIGYKWS